MYSIGPAAAYRQLGEKNARVIDAVVNRGVPWRPLQPNTVSRLGALIRVTFDVPVPPMAFEESLLPPHQTTNTAWKLGRGFEVIDSTGPLTITSATLQGDVVVLALSTNPTGTGLRVRYAMEQDGSGNQGGTALGLRGQLRDSDPFVGADAEQVVCSVSNMSPNVTCPAGSLSRRTNRDRVFGTGLAAEGTVLEAIHNSGSAATLSSPWAGATSMAPLTFAYDLRNYAVHFDLPVP